MPLVQFSDISVHLVNTIGREGQLGVIVVSLQMAQQDLLNAGVRNFCLNEILCKGGINGLSSRKIAIRSLFREIIDLNLLQVYILPSIGIFCEVGFHLFLVIA